MSPGGDFCPHSPATVEQECGPRQVPPETFIACPPRATVHSNPDLLGNKDRLCLPEAQLLQGCSRGEERLSMAHPNPEIFGLTPREESIAVF